VGGCRRGLFLLGWLAALRSLGYGDVRLAALLGLALGWLGWAALLLALFAGLLLAAAGGGVLALSGRLQADHQLPFGPFLLGGAVLAVLVS
jgi:leader peptidase (prepilin peptidase) / N-methyltransferase